MKLIICQIVSGIIQSFVGSVGQTEMSPKTPLKLGPHDEMGQRFLQFELSENCTMISEMFGGSGVSRDVDVVAWMPPVLTEYEIDQMSEIDLAVALGFTENHELIRGVAERRMDAISKFRKREFAQLAEAFGVGNRELNDCFGAQMEMREEIKQRRYILLADHIHVSESGQSHNEILKKCSQCANQAYCYTGGKGEGETEEHHRLQRLADLLIRPTSVTWQWIGGAQMRMLLKREIARKKRDIETAIRWNLCHPAVSSVTLAVTKVEQVPPFLAHSRLQIATVEGGRVSYSDMVRVLGKKQKGVGMIVRADVLFGKGVGAEGWISDGVALALSPHEAAPSLGLAPVFCAGNVGGEHSAVAFSLPVKANADMAVAAVLPESDGVFVKSLCSKYKARTDYSLLFF